jgi:hypothetical protein
MVTILPTRTTDPVVADADGAGRGVTAGGGVAEENAGGSAAAGAQPARTMARSRTGPGEW